MVQDSSVAKNAVLLQHSISFIDLANLFVQCFLLNVGQGGGLRCPAMSQIIDNISFIKINIAGDIKPRGLGCKSGNS